MPGQSGRCRKYPKMYKIYFNIFFTGKGRCDWLTPPLKVFIIESVKSV